MALSLKADHLARYSRPTSSGSVRPTSSSGSCSRPAPTCCRRPSSKRSLVFRTRSSHFPTRTSRRSSPPSWGSRSRRRSWSSRRRRWRRPRWARSIAGKTLLNLDLVGRTLDPHFDPNAAIRRYAGEITRQRMLKALSPGHFLEIALELKDFVQHLPGRVNKIMDLAASNSLQVGVDAIGEKVLVEGFQKVANRIKLGLILAALIVGARPC